MSGQPAKPSITGGPTIVRGYLSKAANLPGQVLSGKAGAGATIQITDEGRLIGTATANAKGLWSFTLGAFTEGVHLLVATAVDPVTHARTASDPIRFMYDVTAPAAPTGLSDTAIQNGVVNAAGDSPGSNILAGKSEPGATITVYDGNQMVGIAKAASDGTWRFSLGRLADGAHNLTATATDGGGNLGPASSAIHFTVSTALPVTTVSDLVAGATTLVGSSEPGATISVIDNGAVLGKITAAADGSWSFTEPFAASTIHRISEKVWDAAGNSYVTGFLVFDSAGAQTLLGSVRDDVLIGAPGDTLTGSEGADHFVFRPGFGMETVTDFRPSGVGPTLHDVLQFDHTLFPDATTALAHASQHGKDVWIAFDPTDLVVLKNVLLSNLHAADFLFS